jgi:uncharacterized hydrophobic protein (TIGR00271 family)
MEYSDFRILAAVGKEEQLSSLLSFACALAKAHDGAVVVLCVTPDGARPKWLQVPGQYSDVAVRVVVRAGESASKVILAAAHDLNPNLLLMGWRGSPGSSRYLLGSTLDPVTRYAPCDVAVVRLGEPGEIRKVLVPMSSGPNAPLAMELALRLPGARVTALNVARESLGLAGEEAGRAQLGVVLQPWVGDERVRAKVVRSPGIVEGILEEAASGYDVVLIGATNQSYIDRQLFGNVPQAVAAEAPVTTVVVRRHAGPVKMMFRRAEQQLSRVQDSLTVAQHAEVYRALREGARATPDFYVLMGLASAVATLGLLLNSPAVVIGAMVIAPLMSSILGISLGVVHGDLRLLWYSAKTTMLGAGLSILVGTAVSVVAPVSKLTSEVMARAQPTLLDLGVAVFAGIVGAYAHCRRDALSALSGVAIAVALAPPLAAAGIGITMLDGSIAGGALLLFLTNLIAIVASGSSIFLLFGFRPDPGERFKMFSRSALGVVAVLAAVSIVLTVLTVDLVRSKSLERQVLEALTAEMGAVEGIELDSWQMEDSRQGTLRLRVQVQAAGKLSERDILELQERIIARLGRPVELSLSAVPVTRFYSPALVTPVPREAVEGE